MVIFMINHIVFTGITFLAKEAPVTAASAMDNNPDFGKVDYVKNSLKIS